MKYTIYISVLIFVFFSCNKTDNDIDYSKSVVVSEKMPRTPLDSLIENNFSKPYNIEIDYRNKSYGEPGARHDISAANPEKAKLVLEALQNLWMDKFKVIAGEEFLKKYSPRKISLYGSANRNRLGVEIISSKSSGVVVSIYRVNDFNPENVESVRRMMRYFTHYYAKCLLDYKPADLKSFGELNFNQYISWDTDNNVIPNQDYDDYSGGIMNKGFFSIPAQSSPADDFAETFSVLLCRTPKEIKSYEENLAVNEYGSAREIKKERALTCLHKKVEFVDKYLKEKYNLNRQIDLSPAMSRGIVNYPDNMKRQN